MRIARFEERHRYLFDVQKIVSALSYPEVRMILPIDSESAFS
jgi:hypothetical protein